MEKQIEGIDAISPADFVDIAKAPCRHQRCFLSLALDNGIDGDRCAVHEKLGGADVDIAQAKTILNPDCLIFRSGKRFINDNLSVWIKRDQIGKSTTDINSNSHETSSQLIISI